MNSKLIIKEDKIKMETNNVILTILCVCVLIVGIGVFATPHVSQEDIDSSIKDALKDLTVPTAEEIVSLIVIPEASEVIIPEVENADNILLNEFLKDQYVNESTEIEDAAFDVAEDEFEDKDYRVVEKYLKTLIGDLILDEDSLDVDVDETTAEVTKLGLEDDEDKCATVTFEFTVEYEYSDSEGFVDEAERLLEIEYTICFTEGDFDDEEVEFVFK